MRWRVHVRKIRGHGTWGIFAGTCHVGMVSAGSSGESGARDRTRFDRSAGFGGARRGRNTPLFSCQHVSNHDWM